MTEEAATPAPRRNWLRRLYDWILHHAKGKYAWELMGAISFAESSFLPIVPDIILIPMVLADRKRWWKLALWCAVTSVAGGWLGYAIGMWLYDSVGTWVINFYNLGEDAAKFRQFYAENGAWIILVKGLTPIPYKLVTITAGAAHYDFWMFTLLSFITRFGRFILVAGLLYWRGEAVRHFIEKHLGLSLLLLLVLLAVGLFLVKYLF
jgi:membrane protein YqaA with SNARE-associated domain